MSSDSFAIIRRSQFWIFQLLGWSVWVVMLALRDLFFVPPEYMFSRVLIWALSALYGAVLTTGLRYLYRLAWDRGFVVRFLVTWFGSLAAALAWQPFRNAIALLPFGEFFDFRNASAEDLFDGMFSSSFTTLLVWSALYFIIKYYQLFQVEKEKSLRSEALAHEAQLLMLRYQLNPHFLFNTLNAISTLVLSKATEQANEMLTKLSKFLRYSLDHSPLDRVSLAHELETSQLYLDIEKVRFGERLKLEFEIDQEAEKALVPTMLLQPIIENSIKHGISRAERGGTICIQAHKLKDRLEIKVIDDGPGLTASQLNDTEFSFSSGVGVSNIRNRLSEIYGEQHQLEFVNEAPHGLTVKVNIPYERE
jgi:two-component system LytT family sensor kinase